MKVSTIKSLVIFILILVVCQFTHGETPAGERLRVLAEEAGILIGYASRNGFDIMADASTYQEVARTEFNILTGENAMITDALQPARGMFNFGQADQHVRFARDNGIAVHGQALLWYRPPSWMANIYDRDQLIDAIYNHIDTVLHYYQGQILVWDVAMEAFNEDGSYRSTVWYTKIGPDYIDLAFQRAHQADPDAKLIYNDYNICELSAKSDGVYAMAESMVARGIPIDGVGFQMHLTADGIDGRSFSDNMARFAALGLEIYITEMDVRINPMPSPGDLENQADIYREVVQRALAQPAVKAIQVWGIPDKHSWVMSTFSGTGAPLLFDDDYNAKPCYYAVQDELANAP
ncbi:MAG: endo-1,4-beta-xylanase, partial [Spirochaetales bacterium]|nr:endo-1,4-beta-xylanase [Spirochaetales bacterium]